MVTRITTAQRFSVALRNILTSLDRVQNVQEDIVTGKRIIRPSDDPGGFSKVSNLRRLIQDSLQFRRNIQASEGFLNVTDQTLSSVRSLLQEARTLAVGQAGAPADVVTRAATAAQIARIRESIIELANAQVGGRFIFAGTAIFTKPFEADGSYRGNIGELDINVGLNSASKTNVTGADANNNLVLKVLSSGSDVGVTYAADMAAMTVAGHNLSAGSVNDGAGTLVVGREYSYVVSAVDTTGESIQSEIVSHTLLAGNDAIDFSFDDVDGAIAYRIYRLDDTEYAATGGAGLEATDFQQQDSLIGTVVDDGSASFTFRDLGQAQQAGERSLGVSSAQRTFTGAGLASLVELRINNNIKEVTSSNNAITISEDGGVRSDTVTVAAGTKTGIQLASDLETALNASVTLNGTYTVAYDQATDKFTISLTAGAADMQVDTSSATDLAALMGFTASAPFAASAASDKTITGVQVTYDAADDTFTFANQGNPPGSIQVIGTATDPTSNAAPLLGFTADSIQTTQVTSNVQTAFNVIAGVNDTLFVQVNGGISTPVTVDPGVYTGETLANQIELRVNNQVKEITSANDSITILEDGGVRSDTVTLQSNYFEVTSANSSIRIVEDGAGPADTITLTTGVKDGTTLATELEAALNASGTLNGTYTVTYSAVTDKFTISVGGGPASLRVDASGGALAGLIGFTTDSPDALAVTSDSATPTLSGAALAADLEAQLNASGTLSGTYTVTYDAATDKFTIAVGGAGSNVGVDVSKGGLAALMGFTVESPFAASVTSDATITGARVDYDASFKDAFTVTSPTTGSSSSISLSSGTADILATLNLNGATPAASRATRLADLNGGEGVRTGTISITNRAGQTFTVDLSTAVTLNDVFGAIESTVTGVKASISADGRRIVLTDTNSPQISNLIVDDVGTTTMAVDLGIKANVPGNVVGRDIDPAVSSETLVTALRSGEGVRLGTVRVRLTEIDLDIGSKATVGEILSTINSTSNISASASISGDGKHLLLSSTDPAKSVLMEDITGSGTKDLGFQGANNALGLLDILEEALLRNDLETVGTSLDILTEALERIGVAQVDIGQISRQFDRFKEQQEEVNLSFTEVLSNVEDTDMVEALTQFSIFQNTLQAALASSAQILQIQLLDFLR